jgi:hypothetical protein
VVAVAHKAAAVELVVFCIQHLQSQPKHIQSSSVLVEQAHLHGIQLRATVQIQR